MLWATGWNSTPLPPAIAITSSIAAGSAAPERSQEICPGRRVYQSRITLYDPPGVHLLGVFVDIDYEPQNAR
jgi:hypothetical protein